MSSVSSSRRSWTPRWTTASPERVQPPLIRRSPRAQRTADGGSLADHSCAPATPRRFTKAAVLFAAFSAAAFVWLTARSIMIISDLFTICRSISTYRSSAEYWAHGDDRSELFHSLLHQRGAIRQARDQVRLVRDGRARQAGFRA